MSINGGTCGNEEELDRWHGSTLEQKSNTWRF